MKKLSLFLFCLFLLNSIKAQIGFHKFSIYGNTGLSIANNFDYQPSNTFFGEIGIKYHLSNGFSVGITGNAVYFRKSINLKDFLVSYYTQYNAGSIFAIYENELIPKWFLGVGVTLNFGKFSGKIYDNFGANLNQTSEIFGNYLSRTVYNYVGFLNVRRHLTNRFDIQLGVSYNNFQSYYLDMYKTTDKVDNYLIGYGGLVFKFGDADGGRSKINSSRIRCPNVRY